MNAGIKRPIPWNKGLKGLLIGWKKGKKRINIVWNKGLKGLNIGEKNGKWIKDRSKLKKCERKDKNVQYIYWSRQVKNRDNWKCRLSNDECKGRLEAHHIKNWIDYPELRYEINNGITLCHFHHPRRWKKEE